MLLWFLWLRSGRIGTLASALKSFDTSNKPARNFSIDWPRIFAIPVDFAIEMVIPPPATKTGVQESKAARVPDELHRADETGKISTGETKEDATNDKETQGGTAANQRAAGSNDKAPENGKD